MTTRGILEKLVSFDSVSGTPGVEKCAEWIAEFAAEKGLKCDRVGGGLILSNGADGARGLVLSGHIDVVPTADQNWSSDPFVLTERHGKLFGRGTSDMKGGVACMMNAMANARAGYPIYLVLTCEEETSDLNILEMAESLRATGKKLSCIVAEPTALRICDRHKGGVTYDVRFIGKAGHFADPKNGVSAIYMFADFAQKFRALAVDFDGATTTIGIVKGGTAGNIIPERCDALIGYRYFDPETGRKMTEKVREILDGVEKDFGGKAEMEKTSDLLPLNRVPNSGIRDLAARSGAGEIDTFPAMTEASILQDAGLDAIVCGPGFIEMAHKPDKYTTAAELSAYDDLLEKIIACF